MGKAYILRYNWVLLMVCILGGCSGPGAVSIEEAGESGGAGEDFLIRLTPEIYIDSAQVFFFRTLGSTDTLFRREIIYDIKNQEINLFHFELPAGNYRMYTFGNLATEVIAGKPPYSASDIYFDYGDGRQPPHLYYGLISFEAGKDTTRTSGLMLLTSSVQLTIRKVPQGVSRIVTRLLNTAAGLNLVKGYLPDSTSPAISDTLYEVRGDSTYLVGFSCFPGVGTNPKSILEVECYDRNGSILYSGTSRPFEARPGYNWEIACSFEASRLHTRGKGKEMYFSLNKK